MYIRLNTDGLVNGISDSVNKITLSDGEVISEVIVNVSKNIDVKVPKKILDEYGNLVDETILNEFGETEIVYENKQEEVYLYDHPDVFTPSEIQEAIKQSRIISITEKYKGANGIITNLLSSWLLRKARQQSTTALEASINQRTTDMNNEILEVYNNG